MKYNLIALAALSLVVACGPVPNQQPQTVQQQVQEQVDCDADDLHEWDTDCGYTVAQHQQRMAFLNGQRYSRPHRATPAPIVRTRTVTRTVYVPAPRPAAPVRAASPSRPTTSTTRSSYSSPVRSTSSYRSSSSSTGRR